MAHLFIAAYPAHIPTFLHPFFTLLQSDPSVTGNFDPIFLVIHLFNEIALEIHDSTVKSARLWSKDRQERDGKIRDVIRSSGDEALAVEGLLGITDKALSAGEGKWLEIAELAMKTMGAWTRESDVDHADLSLGGLGRFPHSKNSSLLSSTIVGPLCPHSLGEHP